MRPDRNRPFSAAIWRCRGVGGSGEICGDGTVVPVVGCSAGGEFTGAVVVVGVRLSGVEAGATTGIIGRETIAGDAIPGGPLCINIASRRGSRSRNIQPPVPKPMTSTATTNITEQDTAGIHFR